MRDFWEDASSVADTTGVVWSCGDRGFDLGAGMVVIVRMCRKLCLGFGWSARADKVLVLAGPFACVSGLSSIFHFPISDPREVKFRELGVVVSMDSLSAVDSNCHFE